MVRLAASWFLENPGRREETTARTSTAEQAPNAPAISIAAQASQHSQSAIE